MSDVAHALAPPEIVPAAPVAAPAPAPTPVTVVEKTETTPEQTMAEVYDKLNPSRERDGKYKSDQLKTVETPAEGAEPSDTAKAETQDAKPAEPATPVIVARPASYSADLDDWWKTLPPERQEFLAKREGEATKKISELGEHAKQADYMRATLEPLRRVAQRNGVSEQEGLNRLLQADEALRREPVSAIQWLAQSYGVDLHALYSSSAPNNGQLPESPQFAALTQQLSRAQAQIGELTSRLSEREGQEAKARMSSLEARVTEFLKGKDYWTEIEGEIVAQISALRHAHPERAADSEWLLSQAHDRAVKFNGPLSERLTKAEREAKAAKTVAEENRKAEEAKRLSSLNVKSSPGKSSPARKSDIEEMEDVYDRVAAKG